MAPSMASRHRPEPLSADQVVRRCDPATLGFADTRGAPELDEIDYGDWTGLSMEQLSARPHWQAFNSIRSCTRIPGGELISEVQARVAALIERLHAQHGAGSVLLISHCDVIRAALAYYLSFPLDLMLRLEIDPASVSIVKLTAAGPSIECVNYTENLPSDT